jgi:hypothetical protein
MMVGPLGYPRLQHLAVYTPSELQNTVHVYPEGVLHVCLHLRPL